MGAVQNHLVAGEGMNSGHDAALDGSVLVQGVSHGGQAVGGAGSGGDDLILSGQGLLIDAVNDGLQIVASGSGDDNLLGASVDVGLALRLGGVEAGALQNNVHADLAPGQILGVLLSIDLDGLAVDSDGILTGGDLIGQGVAALSGVVLQQMGQHSGAGQVVDRHDLITLSAKHLTESQTADAAKAIDSNFNRHW